MERQQTWPKGHQLLTLFVTVWCATSWMTVNVAATNSGIINGPEPVAAGGEKKTMSKVVVQGMVYCEGPSQHHELLKDAEVQVECTNRGTKAREVGRTNARGTFSITLQDYDYEAWGSNGCKAKLMSSLRATCTTPTNMGGGVAGTNLILKEKSKDKVVLTAGPFAFKKSEVAATSQKNLQKSVETKDSSSSLGSGLWYSPPNTYHYTSPPSPHYESPPYHHKSPEHEHHRSEHEGHRERHDHKAREKDCSPKRESHHHKSPAHHSPPYYYKSPPPPYHREHHDTPRHESSPYYKSPPYSNRGYPPHHYTFPPPASYNHMSPLYTPSIHHTPSLPPPHHDTYEAPPKQFYPPPYYQNSNVDTDVKAAPAQKKEISP